MKKKYKFTLNGEKISEPDRCEALKIQLTRDKRFHTMIQDVHMTAKDVKTPHWKL